MKAHVFFFASLLVIILACNQSKENKEDMVLVEKTEIKTHHPLIGTWERTSYYNYNQGKIDSFQSKPENKHIKIFTPHKVMWCRNNAADETEWFGYGDYELTDSLLIETLEYGSKSMNVKDDGTSVYEFKYTVDGEKFSQIRFDSEGHLIFAENYVRVE
ncbi:hypothetical protein KFZ70_14295 [Tamlana fucoidanivorans]|uniref:Lipocalin-like domain-containing protein n=1 Tax=Allotamlana fucoidanivorans TaxID=2583814 RepID=A0A5C4SQL5_9FLAO|nr:hypothetical protein [Tamlana fucoidanivorans]TNJ46598.1 hypothetical protein FGF67_02905 [Tamlana fucoidanivorans]